MNIQSKLLLALLATSSAAFADTAPEAPEIAYNVGVISQYRYRGIAQTKGDAALQGGVDYANSNGFYLGTWASTIKWIKEAGVAANVDAKGPVELDLYGGYKFEANGLAYDVGYLRYEYAGNTYNKIPGAVNANTDEIYGAVTAGVFTAKYSHAFSNLFGYSNSKGSGYLDVSATLDMGEGYSLVPHAGHQTVKNNAGYGYSDFSLTVNKDLGDGLSASLAAIGTSVSTNTNFTVNSYNTAKNAVVAGIKYSF